MNENHMKNDIYLQGIEPKKCLAYEDGCEEWAGCPCVYYKAETRLDGRRRMNIVDVKNAAKLLKDYCNSITNCENCCFNKGIVFYCGINNTPSNWKIDKVEIEEEKHDE